MFTVGDTHQPTICYVTRTVGEKPLMNIDNKKQKSMKVYALS